MHFFTKSSAMIFLPLVALLFTVVPNGWAQDITIRPSLNIRGEYDDNVTFRRTDELDDYLAVTSPALGLSYDTELLNLRSDVVINVLTYADNTDLDTVNQFYNLTGKYRLTERWNLSGDASYRKDTTIDSYLEETGIVSERKNRQRYRAKGGLSYQLDEITLFGSDYSYSTTNFSGEERVDTDSHRVSFYLRRFFQERLDFVALRPSYVSRDSDEDDSDTYEVNLDWSHRFTESITTKTSVGGRYTRIYADDKDRSNSDNWGILADINIEKTGVISSAMLGYKRDLYYTTEGELVEVDRIYCDLKRRILGRLGVGFNGGLYFTREESDESDAEDSTYFELNPSVYYDLTENHILRLGYRYSQDHDDALDKNQSAERHRVWLSVEFNFPKKL